MARPNQNAPLLMKQEGGLIGETPNKNYKSEFTF